MFQGDWIHRPTTTSQTSVTGMKDLPAQAHDLGRSGSAGSVARTQRNSVHHRRRSSGPARSSRGSQLNSALSDRRQPAAEEQQRPPAIEIRMHVGVLGEEEHREGHARVLDHVAGDDLRLAFHHVERVAVGLGDDRRSRNRRRRSAAAAANSRTGSSGQSAAKVAPALPHHDVGHVHRAAESPSAQRPARSPSRSRRRPSAPRRAARREKRTSSWKPSRR